MAFLAIAELKPLDAFVYIKPIIRTRAISGIHKTKVVPEPGRYLIHMTDNDLGPRIRPELSTLTPYSRLYLSGDKGRREFEGLRGVER